MEVDCPETVASSAPFTPQRMKFDPTQPSTSGMGTPSSVILKYENYGRAASRLSNHGGVPSSPFRNQNMSGPSNERVNQLREAAIAKQSYMQQWIGSGYNAPSPHNVQGPHSMLGSAMSAMSIMSTATHLSGMSALSVNTEIASYSWPQNPQQAPYILSKVSGSSVENQDPMTKMRRRMTFNEIVFSLKSNDAMKKMLAIRELIPYAEQNQLETVIQRGELKVLIYTLFDILRPRKNEDEKVVETALYFLYHAVLYPSKNRTCLKIIESLNLEIMGRKMRDRNEDLMQYSFDFEFQHPIGIFDIIMERARHTESRYVTKAWMLLTHLVCNTLFKRRFFAARTARFEDVNIRREVIFFVVESLKQKNLKSKPKGFAVSVVRNLSAANPEIMEMAMQLNVINICLTIMKEETIYEDLLWSTTQALSSFCGNPKVGEIFIRLGGVQVICDLLSHGSSRLLHELLGCMVKIADLPAIQEQDMREPIRAVVNLLGSFDPTIVERSTAILMNIGLYNKANKRILVDLNVADHVFAVLRMTNEYLQLATSQQHSEAIRQQIATIYENCLCVLNNVTIMSAQDNRETAVEACRRISMNVHSAATLLNFICIGKRYCRKLAILILKRVVETVPTYAEIFVDLFATTNEKLPLLLLQRIWESFKLWRVSSKEMMRPGLRKDEYDEMAKKMKDHEDIVRRSAGLLSTLCLECNPRFTEDVKNSMLNAGANPFLFLSHEISDPMLTDWLSFIWKVCTTDESRQQRLLLQLLTNANLLVSPFLKELRERRQDPQIRQCLDYLMQLAAQQHSTTA